MSENTIPPALTPEQWDTLRALAADCAGLDAVTFLEVVLGTEPEPHAASAALLYRRAFGFTREMATSLRLVAAWAEQAAADAAGDQGLRDAIERVREAEARISALLPADENGR